MTAERNDKAMHEVVSKSYQEYSVERAPAHLNRKILSMATAASDAKRGNRLWPKTWTIPLAWAATVGLSLAIVLEVTQIPDVRRDVSTPAAESLREEFEPRNADLLEDAREHAARQSGPNREDRLDAKPRREFETDPQPKTIEPYAPVSEVKSAPSPVRSFAVLDETLDSHPGNSCDAASRETAKTWRACIEGLSQSGFAEDADREYRALALEFPDESSPFDPKK